MLPSAGDITRNGKIPILGGFCVVFCNATFPGFFWVLDTIIKIYFFISSWSSVYCWENTLLFCNINTSKESENSSLGNLRTEELCALCSRGHAKMQFGGCPALHWKVMVFTELSYDQLFTDSLWHTDRAEHRMLLSKSNDTRSVTEWRNICH